MRFSRATALLFVLTGLPLTSALAQTEAAPTLASQSDAPPPPPPGGPRHGGPDRRVAMLQQHLGLNAEQTAQVRSLLEADHTKMASMRENSSLTPEARHAQMETLHQEESSKIRALLTPEQGTKFDAMEARMREHRPGAGGAPPPPPPDGQGPGGF